MVNIKVDHWLEKDIDLFLNFRANYKKSPCNLGN